VYYATTRKLVLQGADGVVFVADSQRRQLEENVESYRDLHEALAEQGIDAREMPLVLQYNKQDLPPELVCSPDELDGLLNFRDVPSFRSDALAGKGVFETLRRASELVLRRLSTPVMAER
jgi:signal recognition particle receptor subunit beta